MTDPRSLVREVIDATRFHSSTRYAWFGRMSPRLPPRIVVALTARTARDYLVHTLAGQLYQDFYVHGRAEPAQWQLTAPTTTRRALEAAMSAANCGQGYVDDGWRVRNLGDGQAVVAKDGLELTVHRCDLLGDVAGGVVALHMPKEMLRIAPGFYTACGNVALETSGTLRLHRIYWHLTPGGAVAFVRAATRHLNAARIPFRLKVLNDLGAFGRCDAGVIYLAESAASTSPMAAVHEEVATHLLERTPAFTERIAAGLASAQDPGTNESFGQHRCRLLAEGLVAAFERGVAGVDDTLLVVEEWFARNGVDLDAPHRMSAPVGVHGAL